MRASLPPTTPRSPAARPPSAHPSAGTSQATATEDPGPSDRRTGLATEPHAGAGPADATGLARPGALSSAAYLWSRWLREGTVVPDEASLVLRAQAAIEQTQAQLPWGRGNVVSDVVATAEESTWRTAAGRNELPTPKVPATRHLDVIADRAAQARFMGAGNCDEFVSLLQVHLAPVLKPSERLEQWGSAHPNHTWCELVSPAGTAQETRWVVDPWAEGRVLPAVDTRMHDHPGRIHVHTLSAEDAPALTLRHDERLAELRDATTPEAALQQARLSLAGLGEFPYPAFDGPDIWTSALQNRLLDRVRRDLTVPLMGPPGNDPGFTPSSHPLRRVLPFVGAHAVARELGAGLREASAVSSQIVQAGVTLGLPRQRPVHVQPEAAQRSTHERLVRRAQADLEAQAAASARRSPSRAAPSLTPDPGPLSAPGSAPDPADGTTRTTTPTSSEPSSPEEGAPRLS